MAHPSTSIGGELPDVGRPIKIGEAIDNSAGGGLAKGSVIVCRSSRLVASDASLFG